MSNGLLVSPITFSMHGSWRIDMSTNQLLPIIVDGVLLPDSLTGELEPFVSVLDIAWDSVKDSLRAFAERDDFVSKMELAFGQGID
jgi:hypothetical protein